MLAAAKAAWRDDRKPANILLVLDTSGSMQDEHRLERAKDGLKAFFKQVGSRTPSDCSTFTDQIYAAGRADRAVRRNGAALQQRGQQPDRRRRHRVP